MVHMHTHPAAEGWAWSTLSLHARGCECVCWSVYVLRCSFIHGGSCMSAMGRGTIFGPQLCLNASWEGAQAVLLRIIAQTTAQTYATHSHNSLPNQQQQQLADGH